MSTNVQPALSGVRWESIENNPPISCSDIHCSSTRNRTQHQRALHSLRRTAAWSIRRRVASELVHKPPEGRRLSVSLCALILHCGRRAASWAQLHPIVLPACICLLAILISAVLSHFPTAEPASTLSISLTCPLPHPPPPPPSIAQRRPACPLSYAVLVHWPLRLPPSWPTSTHQTDLPRRIRQHA